MADTNPTITPRSQDARGARKPAMNTLPIAGVWMKYANMNWLIVPVPPDATMNTVLASVMASGIHSACVWVAIQGTAATSWRTLIGRKDNLNASPNPMRPVGAVAGDFCVAAPDGLVLPELPFVVAVASRSAVSSVASVALAAR